MLIMLAVEYLVRLAISSILVNEAHKHEQFCCRADTMTYVPVLPMTASGYEGQQKRRAQP
jgi:hypothetical protein